MSLERLVLMDAIKDALAKAHGELPKLAEQAAGQLGRQAVDDADFFLTVARSLLAGETVEPNGNADVQSRVSAFLGYIAGERLQETEIYGTPRKMDFSQFKPRGHYEGDEDLERYFRAMMWLGRADLRFVEQDRNTGDWLFRHRQILAAWLLEQAVTTGGAFERWNQANDLITLMVGPVDYIDFRGVRRLATDFGIASLRDLETIDEATTKKLVGDLLGGTYGEQLINSHWLETNPNSAEATPLPPSFAFLGQRFVVDSYVFANVVYDNIVVDDQKIPRVLPNPLDALFVLGNDQILPLLEGELERWQYHANLHRLRFLVDSYGDAFWSSNFYNVWLKALRTLNAPTTGDAYPEPMRTEAWRDRIANTQLGTWAQLRHDTLLYAKQSYTGGVACEHPDGYVEPYPELYQALGEVADLARQTLLNVKLEGDGQWLQQRMATYFETWSTVMSTLESLATKELAGDAFSDDDIAFLKGTIHADPGCGEPVFTGWYKDLYFDESKLAEWEPTIADVHTNPNQGPLPGPNVLHVGTGNAQLMVMTAETCEGPEAYVGPVFSYYEVDVPEIRRLSDSEWETMLTEGTQPQRPSWTASFLVSP